MSCRLLCVLALVGCATDAPAPLPSTAVGPPILDLTITPADPAPGDTLQVDITGAPPNRTVYLGYSTRGSANDTLCPGILQGECIDLIAPVNLVFVTRSDATGSVSRQLPLPATVPDGTYSLQAAVTLGPGNPAGISDVADITVESCTAPGDYFLDLDGDGYGDPLDSITACGPTTVIDNGLALSYVDNADDCNDDNDGAFPGAPEVCNFLDDNCDGQVDENVEPTLWFPDNDEDGFGKLPANCTELQDAGTVVSGVYDIAPFGTEERLRVYCDMETDGGGWTRVLHHDSEAGTNYFADDAAARLSNPDNPESSLYSILEHLESFRDADDTFELRINWPDSTEVGRNIWSQTSNPVLQGSVDNYEAIDVDYTTQFWAGLELSTRAETFINGSVGSTNWFYAIGSQSPWNGGIPGANSVANAVELWVRNDRGAGQNSAIAACDQPVGFVADSSDCDDTDPQVSPAGMETCNGLDDDCNGETDENGDDLWFEDADGDGHGVETLSCAGHLAAGATTDGLYTITPFGDDTTLEVWCDMTTDGGGWTRIFHHQSLGGTTFFLDEADALLKNQDAPDASLYSLLGHLESFRSADGAFDFRIDWPDSTSHPGRNIWSQTSNPTTEAAAGYQAIDIEYTEQFWAGLEYSTRPETFINGSVGSTNWFYAIGSTGPWNGGIPAAFAEADVVQLWVRPEGLGTQTPIRACGAPEGYAATADDCDDTNASVSPSVAEFCDGLDNNCDQVVDELGASTPAHCTDLADYGVSGQGQYTVYPFGDDTPLVVWCDQEQDGGGWTRLVRHDSQGGTNVFSSDADALLKNESMPTASLYSILDHLEAFRSPVDDTFEMRIYWPDAVVNTGSNVWRQTSNPTLGPVEGYEGIDITHTVNGWGGLEPSNNASTFLNGSVGISNWWYSVGTQVDFNGGQPAASETLQVVDLSVRAPLSAPGDGTCPN